MLMPRPIQDDVVYHALNALQGNDGGASGVLNCCGMHDETQNQCVLGPLVQVIGTSLIGEESKAQIPAPDFLDPRQSRYEYVWDDHGFRQLNPVAVNHDHCLPVLECPFHGEQLLGFESKAANQFQRERYYVIAPLRGARVDGAAASSPRNEKKNRKPKGRASQ